MQVSVGPRARVGVRVGAMRGGGRGVLVLVWLCMTSVDRLTRRHRWTGGVGRVNGSRWFARRFGGWHGLLYLQHVCAALPCAFARYILLRTET